MTLQTGMQYSAKLVQNNNIYMIRVKDGVRSIPTYVRRTAERKNETNAVTNKLTNVIAEIILLEQSEIDRRHFVSQTVMGFFSGQSTSSSSSTIFSLGYRHFWVPGYSRVGKHAGYFDIIVCRQISDTRRRQDSEFKPSTDTDIICAEHQQQQSCHDDNI